MILSVGSYERKQQITALRQSYKGMTCFDAKLFFFFVMAEADGDLRQTRGIMGIFCKQGPVFLSISGDTLCQPVDSSYLLTPK